MSKLVCKRCGAIGKVGKSYKGSLFIEIVLWFCFVVPGLIYSIWRQTSVKKVCSVCGGGELIPSSSVYGQKIISGEGTR